MKRILWILPALILLCALCGPSRASVQVESLEVCRDGSGLLRDAPDGAYSSEVLVQEMKLRLLRGEQEQFDQLYKLMKKHFQSPLLLLYRRLGADLRPLACANSAAADLRLCGILVEAAERWNIPAYREHAIKAARRILRFNVYRNVLVNGTSWKERPSGIYSIYEPSHILDLVGVDIQALQRLQKELPEWEPVAQRCLGILLSDASSGTLRLRYNVEKGVYAGDRPSAVEALTIMANLIDGGLIPLRPLETLRAKLARDPALLSRGQCASPAATSLGAYILARAGQPVWSQQLWTSLDGVGEAPSTLESLICLIVQEKLKQKME